jgi:hypothetical protein
MSSTTQPTDFSDLYTSLLNSVRADTGQSVTVTQAKRYINIALQDMHVGFGEKFPWAERRGVIVTQPAYTTGTLSVTQGSATITGVGTLWNTNNAFSLANMRIGGKIRINSGTEVYEITAVASDTSATIGHKFTPADVSAATYTYFEDEYSLADDFLRPIDIQQFSDSMPIDVIDRLMFRRAYPRNYIPGKPVVATLIDLPASGDTTPVRKVRFHKPPDVAYSIPYSYVTGHLAISSSGVSQQSLSADTDEPIVPFRYRHVILFHALYHWYRDRKDDQRSQEAKAEYTDLIQRMTGDTEVGAQRLRFRPANGMYRAKARRPYGGGSNRRFDSGGRFDRFEE